MFRRPVIVLTLAVLCPLLAAGQAERPATLPELESAAQRDSLDAGTLYRLALGYDLAKRYDDAERVARAAVGVDPRYAPAWLLLAYLPYDRRPKLMKQRAGLYNEAIDLYRQAVENDIGLYMAHVHLAQIYEDHGMMPQAVAERRAAANANPDDGGLLLDLGKTLAHANQWVDAEKALQDAVTANPRDPRPQYYLGIVEQHQNKVPEARAAFTEFIALAPSRYAAQINDAKQRLSALP